MRSFARTSKGFTLIELLVSLGIFGIMSVIMYGTFTSITKATGKVSDIQNMTDKGQRIVSYMEEDLRAIGFIVGPNTQITYCGDNATVVSSVSGSPYDSITFLTATPIQIKDSCSFESCAGPQPSYFLTTCADTAAGGTSVNMDAAGTNCYDDIVAAAGANNARSLVTFEALRLTTSSVSGNAPQSYYTVTSLGSALSLNETLIQTIPDKSTVYGVRRYGYNVVPGAAGAPGILQRVSWNADCSSNNVHLLDVDVNNPTLGGVDGLKFEFTWLDSPTNTLHTSYTPPGPTYSFTDLKSITVWVLVRSERVSQDFTSTEQYTLASPASEVAKTDQLTLGPYNDSYRRLLIHKTVEVKNLASIK